MKKFISIFLALLMILSISVPTLAAEITQKTGSGTTDVVYTVASEYTVTIPEYIIPVEPEETPNIYSVTANNVLVEDGKEVKVTVSYDNVLTDDRGAELNYALYYEDNTEIVDEDTILTVDAGTPNGTASTYFVSYLTEDVKYAGVFTDLVTFNFSVEDEPVTILDYGQCGDTLYWSLNSAGELRIYGEGEMYDYEKAIVPSPWYKYRYEPYISEDGTTILNSDGTEYISATTYYASNPNEWYVESVVIEEGVTYLGDWAFYRICVEELTIPEGVEETGYFCIRFSPTLKTVNLPDSLKVLGDYGISRNYELETINFGDSLETIGRAGLNYNTSIESIILPDSVTEVNVLLNTSGVYSGSGDVDPTNVGLMENCYSLTEVSLGSITSIPQRTLNGASLLESIVIPNTVETIDEYAFRNCTSLTNVLFEEGSVCTYIGDYAFFGCRGLVSFTGCTALKSIGNNAFTQASLTSLEEFTFSDTNVSFQNNMFANSKLTTAYLGDSLEVTNDYMFMNCTELKTVTISSKVTTFGTSLFKGCTSLADIYYEGTLEQWNAITKGNYWANNVPSRTCVVHFSDGTTASLADVL